MLKEGSRAQAQNYESIRLNSDALHPLKKFLPGLYLGGASVGLCGRSLPLKGRSDGLMLPVPLAYLYSFLFVNADSSFAANVPQTTLLTTWAANKKCRSSGGSTAELNMDAKVACCLVR